MASLKELNTNDIQVEREQMKTDMRAEVFKVMKDANVSDEERKVVNAKIVTACNALDQFFAMILEIQNDVAKFLDQKAEADKKAAIAKQALMDKKVSKVKKPIDHSDDDTGGW